MATTAGRRSKIGTAYIALVPSFDGFFVATDREMTRKLPMIMEKVFKDIGKESGKEFGIDFARSFESVIDSRMRSAINSAANVTVTIPAPVIPTPIMPNMPTLSAPIVAVPQVPVPVVPAPVITPVPAAAAAAAGAQAGQQMGQTMGAGIAEAVQAAVAGVAAMALGGQVIQTFTKGMDKEAGGDKLKAQLRLNAEEAAKLSAVSEKLYTTNYGPDRETINENMKSIVGSIKGARQASSEELLKMGQDAANLSSTFGIETAELAKSVSSQLSNGIAQNWDEAVANVAAGFQDMGERGEDWNDTLAEYSGTFADFGLSGKQAFGLINNMVNQGGFFNTDTAADAIREAGIQARSGENADFLAAIGLDPLQVQKAANQGGEAWLQQFSEIMQKLDKVGNKSLYGEIIGTQAEDQLASIMKTDWSKVTEPVADLSGRLKEIDKDLNGNGKASLDSFMRSVESLFIKVIEPAITWITPKLIELTEWLGKNEGVITALAIVIGGALVVSAIAATVAFWGMMAPFFPIIGIVLAIVAGVALMAAGFWLLAENWNTIAAFGYQVWGGFMNWWNQLWGGFGSMMADFGNNTVGMFVDMGKHIGNFFIGIANGFIKMWNGMINAINGVQIHMPEWLGGGDWNGLGLPTVGEIPMMKNGGTIMPKGDGIPTIIGIAEDGKAESVVDSGLLNQQLKTSTEVMQNMTTAPTQPGNLTIQIFQQPGESTEEMLARLEELQDFRGYFE
jgi:phage-related minor tail protein